MVISMLLASTDSIEGGQCMENMLNKDGSVDPVRKQAIIWTNDGKFTDAHMHHSASMS